MSRNYTVKVKDRPPFSMGGIDDEESAEHVCRSVFRERLEWVTERVPVLKNNDGVKND